MQSRCIHVVLHIGIATMFLAGAVFSTVQVSTGFDLFDAIANNIFGIHANR
jgi:phosphotransferase system IIA component